MEKKKRMIRAVSTALKESFKQRLREGLYPILRGTNLMHSKLFDFPDRREGVDYKTGAMITVDFVSRLFNPKFYHVENLQIVRDVTSSVDTAKFLNNEGGYDEVTGYKIIDRYNHPHPYEFYFMVSVWTKDDSTDEADAIVEAIQQRSVLPERGYVPVELSDGNIYNWNLLCGDITDVPFKEISKYVSLDDSQKDLYRVDMIYVVEGFLDPFLVGERIKTIHRYSLEMYRTGDDFENEVEEMVKAPTER